MMFFEVSGIETWWWLPPLAAFLVSLVSSSGGLSGAVFLIPFQVSILGFAGPAVTPTNFVFNLLAPLGGVFQYFREGRLVWPIVFVTLAGTLPGLLIGVLARVHLLADPSHFKIFVALVLLYLAVRLLIDLRTAQARSKPSGRRGDSFLVTGSRLTWREIEFSFGNVIYRAPVRPLALLSLAVGIIGGAYGIGGGAIIAPFLVSTYRLPIYAVAGASLLGTFVTSVLGILLYSLSPSLTGNGSVPAQPDWPLGLLLGFGGIAGAYLGARTQRHIPERWIKFTLAAILIFVAVTYLGPLVGL